MYTLEAFINDIEIEISKAKIYRNFHQLKKQKILLNLLLELQEHRKIHNITHLFKDT